MGSYTLCVLRVHAELRPALVEKVVYLKHEDESEALPAQRGIHSQIWLSYNPQKMLAVSPYN